MARRQSTLLGFALTLVLVASSCTSSPPGEGALLLTAEGRVVVAEGDEEIVVSEGQRRIGYEALVEVVSGVARVRYPDGAELELREGLGTAADTRVRTARLPELVAGDLLVEGADGMGIVGPYGTVELAGAAKVGSGLGLSVHVYEGAASVSSAGRSIQVAALREVVVPAPRLVPRDASPFRYRATDPWDRRFLGTAIDLGEQLAARARGFTAQLRPGEGRSPGFFRLIVPGLESEADFRAELVSADLAPGETLVGAAIALESSKADAFAARWADAFAFRAAGAEWGLVALDHRVDDADLLARVDLAIGRAPVLRPGGPGTVASPPTVPGGDTTPTTRPTGPTTPTTGPTPTTATTGPAPTTTTLVPTTPTTEPPDDDGGLLDLLRGLGSESGPLSVLGVFFER